MPAVPACKAPSRLRRQQPTHLLSACQRRRPPLAPPAWQPAPRAAWQGSRRRPAVPGRWWQQVHSSKVVGNWGGMTCCCAQAARPPHQRRPSSSHPALPRQARRRLARTCTAASAASLCPPNCSALQRLYCSSAMRRSSSCEQRRMQASMHASAGSRRSAAVVQPARWPTHLHKLEEVCQAGVQLSQRRLKVVALHRHLAQQAVHVCRCVVGGGRMSVRDRRLCRVCKRPGVRKAAHPAQRAAPLPRRPLALTLPPPPPSSSSSSSSSTTTTAHPPAAARAPPPPPCPR